MNNNTIPAHFTHIKITTPHDSYSRLQFETTTNDTASYSGSSARSRLGSTSKQSATTNNDLKSKTTTNSYKQNNINNNVYTTKINNNNRNTSVSQQQTNTGAQFDQLMMTTRCWRSLIPSTAACVTILILTTSCSLCSASLCEPQSWWDSYKDKCIPCTVCQSNMLPLRPCEMHRDTICGSIYDLKIDWVLLSKTEPNWKERRKFDGLDYGLDHHELTAEQLQQLQDEIDPMDWQTAALFLAVLACLLFFIVAACILVHHMRQWRRMERRLDQDVEELSTKLMAKLAEVQSLEGGTFFIGNADALRIPTTTTMTTATTFHQPQHVMLPEKSDKQHHHHQQHHHNHDRRIFNTMTTMKSGNVYIEENGSKC